jgi:hypothetical protein
MFRLLANRLYYKSTRYSVSQLTFIFIDKDNLVGIVLGYGLEDRGFRVRFPAGAGNFYFQHCVQNGSGAHSASYPKVSRALSLGVKRPVREADHLPPSSAEVKE